MISFLDKTVFILGPFVVGAYVVGSFIHAYLSLPPSPQDENEYGRVEVLGSNGGGFDRAKVIEDIRINDLHIRRVREEDAQCNAGYDDHLELDGPIDADTSFIVAKLLEAIDEDGKCHFGESSSQSFSTRVYLNSRGGKARDGFKLAEIFKENQVDTHIAMGQKCFSACAVAFLGGKYRTMHSGGNIGFHAGYYIDKNGKITCARRSESSDEFKFYTALLGQEAGSVLYNREMDFCQKTSSELWSPNADAALLFGIATHKY